MEIAAQEKIGGLYPAAGNVTAEAIGHAIRSEFTVRGWRVRTQADLIAVWQAGAQGATVNWPDVAAELLSQQENSDLAGQRASHRNT